MAQRPGLASRLELKVPPPLVAAAVAALMWALGRITPSIPAPPQYRLAAAVVLLAAGIALGVSAIVVFFRAHTTIEPTRPQETTRLVTAGPYRFTRNPMYVALLLVLLAYGVFLANAFALAATALFVAYISRFQIRPEERFLAECFGTDYEGYRSRVQRWV